MSLVKLAKSYAEKAKVGVRKVRQKAMTDLKKQKTISSDTIHRLEKYVCVLVLCVCHTTVVMVTFG